MNDKLVFDSLKNNRETQKPKLNLGDLVGTADIKRVFSKRYSTNWLLKIYTITEFIHDTIFSYRNNHLPERYNQNLLLPTKLSLEETIKLWNNQI